MNVFSLPRVFGVLAATALCLAAPVAHAISFNFTVDHVTGGIGQAAPFGTVTLTQNGGQVDFVVALLNGNKFVRTGAGDSEFFKFNGLNMVVGDIVGDTAGITGQTGALNGNGTGNFTFGVTNVNQATGGGAGVLTSLSFHVLNSVITDFTVPNNNGYLFAADIISGTNGFTGPIAVLPTPGTSVPDGGATVALLGLSLAALALVRRKMS